MPFLSASGMSPYNKIRGGGGESAPVVPLLLDVYTGAAAAYSLRKIALATTNVIRVRRSSDSAEQDFTAEQITDGTLLAFTGSGDGRVVTWYDQSGNNAHATQVTQNKQPRIVSSGVLVLDSSGVNPTMEFHVLNVGSVLNAPLVGSQPFTLFNLRRYRVGGTTTRVAIGYAGSGNSYADNNIGGSFRSYYGAYVIQGANNTNRGLFYSLANGASTAVSLNGGSEVIGNAGTSGASALTIGAAGLNFPPEMNEQEVIIYNSNQSSNKAGILTNINTHYNLYPEPISGFLYDYSGASVAYSLRQLGVYADGNEVNVVRVRRSSDSAEQDFTSTEITDGTLLAFTGSGDGFVSKWFDQSANGNHAEQLTAINQPKLVSAGVVVLDNGKPAIDYAPGAGDSYFEFTQLNNIRSIFYVLNAVTAASSFKNYILGNSYLIHEYDSGAGQQWIYTSMPSFITSGNNKINGVTTDLTTTNRQLNQVLLTLIHTASSGTADQISKDRGLSGRSWRGKMQELIMYPSDQTTDLTAIDININTFYKIYAYLPYNGSDVDANAYINAGGITNFVEIAAIEQLVSNLKGTGNTTNNSDVWNSLHWINLASATSLAASLNDLKGGYNLTAYNSPTWANTGIKGNGANMYLLTSYIANNHGSILDSNSFGCAVRTTQTTASGATFMGVRNSSTNPYNAMVVSAGSRYYGNNSPFIQDVGAGQFPTGIFINNRTNSSNFNIYFNNVLDFTGNVPTNNMATAPMGVLCQNNGGTAAGFSNMEFTVVFEGQGLTANQMQDLNDSINTLNANIIEGGR